MRNYLLFTVAVSVLGACGEAPEHEVIASSEETIVNGEDAPVGALPYMVSLHEVSSDGEPVSAYDSQFCGGTLIDAARGLVLTAAHCVSEEYPIDGDWWSDDPANWAAGVFPPELFRVTIGAHTLSEVTEDDYHQVLEIIAHPGFDFWNIGHDIAILRVEGVDPSTPVPRIIGSRFQDPLLVLPGITATVAGWGNLEDGGDGADTLQWVRLPIVERNLCNYLHQQEEDPVTVTTDMMCAGPFSGARDACHGDSGGPLLVRDLNGRRVLAGIVSWNDGCAKPWRPGVYTNVLTQRAWLHACTEDDGCERMAPYPL